MTHEADLPIPAVVVNPVKLDNMESTRKTIAKHCAQLGWAEPVWLETSAQDPGTGQTKMAVSQSADVVIAMGGDGTVRSVSKGLDGTGVAMGVVPLGTGNLLARNLNLPLGSMAEALHVCLTGDDRPMDMGTLRYRTVSGDRRTDAFLVMTGVGFDAEIMNNTPSDLKATIGPTAYTVTGLSRFLKGHTPVTFTDPTGSIQDKHVRSIIIGNVGSLFGGVELMPDARVDDGLLDCAMITARSLTDWVGLTWQVITRQARDGQALKVTQGEFFQIDCAEPMEAQIDGDAIGEVMSLRVEVKPGALAVRVPSEDPVDSLVDPQTAAEHADRVEQGRIDLRPFDIGRR